LLNDLFSGFDKLAETYQLEKIKTIGDSYMVVGGIPTPEPDHAGRCAEMALDMLEVLKEFNHRNSINLDLRVGLNSGPVVAGIIGTKKFSYDLWGIRSMSPAAWNRRPARDDPSLRVDPCFAGRSVRLRGPRND